MLLSVFKAESAESVMMFSEPSEMDKMVPSCIRVCSSHKLHSWGHSADNAGWLTIVESSVL